MVCEDEKNVCPPLFHLSLGNPRCRYAWFVPNIFRISEAKWTDPKTDVNAHASPLCWRRFCGAHRHENSFLKKAARLAGAEERAEKRAESNRVNPAEKRPRESAFPRATALTMFRPRC